MKIGARTNMNDGKDQDLTPKVTGNFMRNRVFAQVLLNANLVIGKCPSLGPTPET